MRALPARRGGAHDAPPGSQVSAERIAALAAGALAGGYLVGSLPVAWIMVRRHAGVDLRRAGAGRVGTLEAVAAGGMRTLVAVVLLELIKGAVVGIGARTYSDTAWFTVTAIAGCVAGDAFPIAAVSDATVDLTSSAAMVINPISAASAAPNFSPVTK